MLKYIMMIKMNATSRNGNNTQLHIPGVVFKINNYAQIKPRIALIGFAGLSFLPSIVLSRYRTIHL